MINEVNKNNSNINAKQNKKIAALEAKFSQLKKLSAMPKKARKRVSKQNRVARASHPLMPQVRALLNPSMALPGSAHHLIDVAPSQKYSLKSRFTLAVGAGNPCVGLVSPCFIDTAGYASAIFVTGSTAQLASATIQNSNLGASAFPTGATGVTVRPTRPYSSTAQMTWRLVSYQLRVRYAGTALNANGNFKNLNNVHGEMGIMDSVSSTTWAQLFDEVDRNTHTSLRTVHERAIQDYPCVGSTMWLDNDSYYGADINAVPGSIELVGETIGQASSAWRIGEPGLIFTYTNSSTSSINLECELYENWEVRGPTVAPFVTPSHPDPILHEEIMRTIVSSHIHASKDSGMGSMNRYLKLANAESKTPIGKAVIAAALA